MLKQGFSGFNVGMKDGIVVKQTTGVKSSQILKHDILKQIRSIGKLYPIASVPILKVEYDKSFFKCEMPFMGFDLRDQDLSDSQIEIVKQQIIQSLKNRSSKITYGFNSIILKELNRILGVLIESGLEAEADQIEKESYRCSSDYYIQGYCHGDLGLANMFLVGGRVYANDFTRSFIDSPLVDIVMLKQSKPMKIYERKQKMIDEIESEFYQFKDQMDLILKIKQLGWKYRA